MLAHTHTHIPNAHTYAHIPNAHTHTVLSLICLFLLPAPVDDNLPTWLIAVMSFALLVAFMGFIIVLIICALARWHSVRRGRHSQQRFTGNHAI